MDSAFEIEFEELPLEVDGKETGMFWGVAHFNRDGACIQIDIEAADKSIVSLTLRNTTIDKNALFRMIHVTLLRRCSARILDAMHDYHYSSREQSIVDMALFLRSE